MLKRIRELVEVHFAFIGAEESFVDFELVEHSKLMTRVSHACWFIVDLLQVPLRFTCS